MTKPNQIIMNQSTVTYLLWTKQTTFMTYLHQQKLLLKINKKRIKLISIIILKTFKISEKSFTI